MRPRTSRPFTVMDSMILVAATGVGLAAIREFSPVYYMWQFTPIPPPTWLRRTSVVVAHWAFYFSPIPASWTLAILGLRLRQPRPRLRRLLREPGMVASCAAALGIAIGIAHYVLDRLNQLASWHMEPFEFTAYFLGGAVGGAWLILGLGGRWRAEPTWIDRLGRAIGVYWIGMVPLVLAYHVIGD